jgi:L-amino acid N-acyltransferase YncA
MLPKQIINYRNLVVLKDGSKVLLRALTPDDNENLTKMFSQASNGDVRFLRDDVKDPAVIESWCEGVDYSRVLPIVAVVQNHVVGLASLHFGSGPERHIGGIRIYLAREYRRRGLGTKMVLALIDLARKHGLFLLEAEVVASQNKVIKAFQNMGFQLCCTFEDYFMLPDGGTQDVARLILNLNPKSDEF